MSWGGLPRTVTALAVVAVVAVARVLVLAGAASGGPIVIQVPLHEEVHIQLTAPGFPSLEGGRVGCAVRSSSVTFDDCAKLPDGLGTGYADYQQPSAQCPKPYYCAQLNGRIDAPHAPVTLRLAFSTDSGKTWIVRTYTVIVKGEHDADLSVEVRGPDKVKASEASTFTVVVHNAGSEDAKNVTATIHAPFLSRSSGRFPHVTSTPGTCTPSIAGGVIDCQFGTLAKGASAMVEIHLQPIEHKRKTGILATVTSGTPDADKTNNHASLDLLVQAEADIAVVISGPPSASGGDDVAWVIRVVNKGPDRTEVKLADAAPAGVSFKQPLSKTAGLCRLTAAALDCSVQLAKGEKAAFTLRGAVAIGAQPGTIANEATVSTDDEDPTLFDHTAVAKTRIR